MHDKWASPIPIRFLLVKYGITFVASYRFTVQFIILYAILETSITTQIYSLRYLFKTGIDYRRDMYKAYQYAMYPAKVSLCCTSGVVQPVGPLLANLLSPLQNCPLRWQCHIHIFHHNTQKAAELVSRPMLYSVYEPLYVRWLLILP